MAAYGLTFLFAAALATECGGQTVGPELFKNPGMEDPDIVGTYGQAWGYKVDRVTDSHSGSYAVKVSGR